MTLPASGWIDFNEINGEVGHGGQVDLGWIKSITKGNPNDLNSYHNLTYYQSNNQGNCNNGNCACNCTQDLVQCGPAVCDQVWSAGTNRGASWVSVIVYNCNASLGNDIRDYPGAVFQCMACEPATCINCSNCDAQPYLQNNCNCNCTYNCQIIGALYNPLIY